MKDIELTTALLDNEVKSAVINIGSNNGYVEVFLDDHGSLCVMVVNDQGDYVHSWESPWPEGDSAYSEIDRMWELKSLEEGETE